MSTKKGHGTFQNRIHPLNIGKIDKFIYLFVFNESQRSTDINCLYVLRLYFCEEHYHSKIFEFLLKNITLF